ncbi:MAG TPA: hypothetical protein VHX59_11820 [Mycobacteriales bacterium]|nr:hypothetical protein [Mycobacteriales bacterium]
MLDPGLDIFANVRWQEFDHRAVRARLEGNGWTKCGEGDWAVVLRSPQGRLAVRISAFEPSYSWFVELCDRVRANPYLPRIELVSELEGGGHLAVLEYLTPVSESDAKSFLARWNSSSDPDLALRALRAATDALDAECRRSVPFWMGVDLGDHVMRSMDGHVKLIDLLGVGGGPMVELIRTDIDAFLRIIPRDRCRYMLDIPHFGRSYAEQDRRTVAAAFAAYDGRTANPGTADF